MLDSASRTHRYADAVESCRASLDDPRRLPSARVLDEMRARSEAFFEFAMRTSEEHRATLLAAALPPSREAALVAAAVSSHRAQRETIAPSGARRTAHLERYFSQHPEGTTPAEDGRAMRRLRDVGAGDRVAISEN